MLYQLRIRTSLLSTVVHSCNWWHTAAGVGQLAAGRHPDLHVPASFVIQQTGRCGLLSRRYQERKQATALLKLSVQLHLKALTTSPV